MRELFAVGARRDGFAAEADRAFGVALDELPDLVDDGEGVHVALALRLAPGEEAMAAQHDAVAAGIFAHRLAHASGPVQSRAAAREARPASDRTRD